MVNAAPPVVVTDVLLDLVRVHLAKDPPQLFPWMALNRFWFHAVAPVLWANPFAYLPEAHFSGGKRRPSALYATYLSLLPPERLSDLSCDKFTLGRRPVGDYASYLRCVSYDEIYYKCPRELAKAVGREHELCCALFSLFVEHSVRVRELAAGARFPCDQLPRVPTTLHDVELALGQDNATAVVALLEQQQALRKVVLHYGYADLINDALTALTQQRRSLRVVEFHMSQFDGTSRRLLSRIRNELTRVEKVSFVLCHNIDAHAAIDLLGPGALLADYTKYNSFNCIFTIAIIRD